MTEKSSDPQVLREAPKGQKKRPLRRPRSKIAAFMTSYHEGKKNLESSRILRGLYRREGLRLRLLKRTHFLSAIPIGRPITRLKTSILTTKLSVYALFFAPIGIVSALRYLILPYFFAFGSLSLSPGIAGAFCCLLSLFLLSRRDTALDVCEQPTVLSYLLFEALAIKPPHVSAKKPFHPLLLLAGGLLWGAASWFVSPLLFLGILLLLFLLLALFKSPELGLMCIALFLPFSPLLRSPTVFLLALLALTALSYIFKLLIGKRCFSFEPLDLFVLLLSLFYFGGGLFALGDNRFSPLQGIACGLFVLFAYFPVANLLSSRRLLLQFCRNLLFSVSLLAFIGLMQQILGLAVPGWLDENASYISGRITAFIHNPNVLACYLVFALPLLFSLLGEDRRFRGGHIASLLLLLSALALTWSRGAWVGLLLSLFLFILLAVRKPARIFFWISLFLPNLLLFAPESFIKRFSSIFSFLGPYADSSIYYRFQIWRSSLLLFFDNLWGGIGISSENFLQCYLPYAANGAELAEHAHNLYLQIGIEMGIFALVAFLLLLIVVLRRLLSSLRGELAGGRPSTFGIGAFCSIFALLVFGAFDHVLYDFRIFFLFFAAIGLVSAAGRMTDKPAPAEMSSPTDGDFAEAEIRLPR